PPRKRRRVA
nr:Chain B, PVII [Frog siadenovirus A]8U36_C Chain C, PVII [Frog siadenovirus A]